MARHLFLVSRQDARLYEYLVDRFRDDRNVEVILDRRHRDRRRQRQAHAGGERRRGDRRMRRELDLELQIRSHVILTIPDEDTLPLA